MVDKKYRSIYSMAKRGYRLYSPRHKAIGGQTYAEISDAVAGRICSDHDLLIFGLWPSNEVYPVYVEDVK